MIFSSSKFGFFQIQAFKLEVILFIKELNSYIENVNEIDDEAIKLLIEAIVSVNKLQANSKFHAVSSCDESAFVNHLDDDIFECRRFIVCCLCHVSIVLFDFLNNLIHTKTEAMFIPPLLLRSKFH